MIAASWILRDKKTRTGKSQENEKTSVNEQRKQH